MGTLFIDEIADMPLTLQAKILRAMDPNTREIQRLGDPRPIKVNVRVIGATNKDIKAAMEKRDFRTDLYGRFGKVITLPPLRERKEDIPLLAHYFLDKYSKSIKSITHEAIRALEKYNWPRNVRELESCVKNAILKAADKDFLYLTDFCLTIKERKPEKGMNRMPR
jgi:transcriptional regulator with GAF, ATPase, and Fis domain